MDYYFIEQNIELVCVRATAFPAGVLQAHQTLHGMLPRHTNRTYYGISYPGAGHTIVYLAAAAVLHPTEATLPGTETFTVKSGEYACLTVHNFYHQTERIGLAFQQLLTHPRLNPIGFCLEVYVGDKDVRCMVPLLDR